MPTWLFVIATALVLSGCSGGPARYVQGYQPTASDGRGSPPTIRGPRATARKPIHKRVIEANDVADKKTDLTGLKAYSPEWWAVHDAIDRANDAKLAKALIICRGCLPSTPEDRTGSIGPR